MNISQKTTDGAFDLEVDELIVNETSDFKKDATYEEDLLLKGNEFTLTIGSSYLLDASIPFIFPPTIGGGGNALLTDGFGNTSWGTTVSYVAISVPPQFTINGGSSASTTTSATFNIELNNPTGTGKFVLNTNPTINTPTFVNDSTFLGNIIIEDGALTSISYMVLSRKKISFDIEVLGLSTTLAYTGLNSTSTAFEITSSVPFIFTAESTFIFSTGAINWTTGVITYETPISFIAPLASAFSITTGGGLIEMITGLGSIGLNAEFGGITLSSLEGGIVLNTSIGVISLSTEIGVIALTTGSGALALTTAAGFITLTTGAGGIEINTGIGVGLLSGTGVSVNCVFGDIGMTSQVGNVNIRSSTGALQLFGGGGGVNIGTSSSDAVGHLIVHARNGSTAPQTGSIEFYTHDNGIFTGAGDFYVNTTEAQTGNWLMAIKGECRIANSIQFKIDYLAPIGPEDKCIQVSGSDGYFKSIPNTGTGNNVLSTSPTLVTPILGSATGTTLYLSGGTDLNGYLQTNSSNLSSTTLLNPGILLFSTLGSSYGMDLGYAGSRYRTRTFCPTSADIVFSSGNSLSLQSSFTDHVIINGSTGVIKISALIASSAVATDASKNLVSVTNTGSGNNVLSISPTITTPTIVGAATGTSLSASSFIISQATVNGGNGGLYSRNFSTGSDAYSFLSIDNGTNGLILFTNSSTRTDDGGINAATIRNDAGPLIIANSGTTSSFTLSGSNTFFKTTMVGTLSPGLTSIDLSTNDNYLEARVIRNSRGADKDLYLNFAAGATSSTRVYTNNVQFATFQQGDRIILNGTNTYIYSNATKALWFSPSYGLVVNTSVSFFSTTQTVGNNANTILAFWGNRRGHGDALGYSSGLFQNNTGRIITCTISYTAQRTTNGFGITAFWIEPTYNTDRYAANDVGALDKASGTCTLILNPSDGFFLYTFQNSGANADYGAGNQFLSYFYI